MEKKMGAWVIEINGDRILRENWFPELEEGEQYYECL